jgi:hypothetical protein
MAIGLASVGEVASPMGMNSIHSRWAGAASSNAVCVVARFNVKDDLVNLYSGAPPVLTMNWRIPRSASA